MRICVLAYVTLLAVIGGLEVGLVFGTRVCSFFLFPLLTQTLISCTNQPVYERGNNAPVTVLGIVASVMIGGGLLPQYYEIWKHKEVIGISIPFMLVDLLGGIFNDLSLVFKEEFDVLAGVCYSIVVVCQVRDLSLRRED